MRFGSGEKKDELEVFTLELEVFPSSSLRHLDTKEKWVRGDAEEMEEETEMEG